MWTHHSANICAKQPIVGTLWTAIGTVMTTAAWSLCQRKNCAHEGHISCSTREEMSSLPGPPTAQSEVSEWAFVATFQMEVDWHCVCCIGSMLDRRHISINIAMWRLHSHGIHLNTLGIQEYIWCCDSDKILRTCRTSFSDCCTSHFLLK